LLAGARGQLPRDQAALVKVMKGLSELVINYPEIDQIDLNPVLVYDKDIFVVDVRIFTRSC
jgi:hypothetical protein